MFNQKHPILTYTYTYPIPGWNNVHPPLNNPKSLFHQWIITVNKWLACFPTICSQNLQATPAVTCTFKLLTVTTISWASELVHGFWFHLRGRWGGSAEGSLWTAQRCVWCFSLVLSLSSPRYARQGFLASTAWECSPDEPVFTICLLRSPHRKLERKKVKPKLKTWPFFYLKFTVTLLTRLSIFPVNAQRVIHVIH